MKYWQQIVAPVMQESKTVADEIDIANERAQLDLDNAIKANSAHHEFKANGFCYNCGDRVLFAAKFCDVNCRNDWQARHPGE